MTDNELQHLLKAEPEKGQRAFYDKYFNYVYTIVFAKLKTIASIEDVDECWEMFSHSASSSLISRRSFRAI